jgi:hypothetical protein
VLVRDLGGLRRPRPRRPPSAEVRRAEPQLPLLTGPIESIVFGLEESANLWWPDDHSWCIATEVDLNTTYIGCKAACGDEILARPEIEAFPIDPASGITFDSDRVNPQPRRSDST